MKRVLQFFNRSAAGPKKMVNTVYHRRIDMDFSASVITFFESIDFSLLLPVLGALVAFLVVLRLKQFVENLAAFLSVKRDKDIRIGSLYRFGTSTGHKIGVLTRWDFKYTRFRFDDHYERIPNRDLAHGRLAIVKIEPSEGVVDS